MTKGMRVIQNGDGSHNVELGTVLSALITAAVLAAAGALVTVGILGWRATASETKIAAVETDLARQGRNQMRLDERQRHIRKDVRWANDKLDAVLQEIGSTRRITEPDLPSSSLERPTESGGAP